MEVGGYLTCVKAYRRLYHEVLTNFPKDIINYNSSKQAKESMEIKQNYTFSPSEEQQIRVEQVEVIKGEDDDNEKNPSSEENSLILGKVSLQSFLQMLHESEDKASAHEVGKDYRAVLQKIKKPWIKSTKKTNCELNS
ncbi:hypothetical protein Ciccas_012019 [Cichlidogyrus casuarinus]|uniref:Uncharacterized protein n=1 Tax=Cichlidogyrus casuarinus TaxID=1844966 RepID=A0ABD2PPK6_9PLAT